MKIYNIIFIILFFTINFFGKDLVLSQNRQDLLKYSQNKIQEDSAKLKTDWINSITYSYSYLKGDTTTNNIQKQSKILISQPIFKSGGIYNAIKYASALHNSNSIAITLEEKELIKNATTSLFNIYKNELLIQKQKLILLNNLIDVRQKKEKVLNGLLDISYLNNAILENNKQKENLLDLQFQHTSLINELNNLTATSVNNFKLPVFKLINKKNYLENNIYIKQSKATTKTKQYLKGITKSKYLPTVNANYTYADNHTANTINETYGFSVNIPFNIGTFNDISSSKIDFLKSKTNEKITKRIEENYLKTKLAKLDMIDKKIDLTKENIKSYKSLLIQMKELQKEGLKTTDDVLILTNSKNAETLNLKIFSIDRQIELLQLYARIQD